MTKTTLVMSAEQVFVKRLLAAQCPINSWEDEYHGETVWHVEFNIELCCDGNIGIVAIQRDIYTPEYELIKSWRKPVNAHQAIHNQDNQV